MHTPPTAWQAWTKRDTLVGGVLLAVIAVSILLAVSGVPRAQPLVGLALILGLAYACSSARSAIDYRTVAWGLSLQFLFAIVVLKTAAGQRTFQVLGGVINRVLDIAFVGSSFVFGPLGSKEAWPRIMTAVLGPEGAQYGVIFAFQVLPTIIFIAALFAMLYYFGIMQIVVRVFAVGMRFVMRAESGAAGRITDVLLTSGSLQCRLSSPSIGRRRDRLTRPATSISPSSILSPARRAWSR